MRDIGYAIEEQVSSMAFFMTYMSNIVEFYFITLSKRLTPRTNTLIISG